MKFAIELTCFLVEKQIPPTPFNEGGVLMDPLFSKRGWGDLELIYQVDVSW